MFCSFTTKTAVEAIQPVDWMYCFYCLLHMQSTQLTKQYAVVQLYYQNSRGKAKNNWLYCFYCSPQYVSYRRWNPLCVAYILKKYVQGNHTISDMPLLLFVQVLNSTLFFQYFICEVNCWFSMFCMLYQLSTHKCIVHCCMSITVGFKTNTYVCKTSTVIIHSDNFKLPTRVCNVLQMVHP